MSSMWLALACCQEVLRVENLSVGSCPCHVAGLPFLCTGFSYCAEMLCSSLDEHGLSRAWICSFGQGRLPGRPSRSPWFAYTAWLTSFRHFQPPILGGTQFFHNSCRALFSALVDAGRSSFNALAAYVHVTFMYNG